MKKTGKRAATVVLVAMMTIMASMVIAGATAPDWTNVYQPVVKLIDSLLTPILMVVGAVGTIFCIFLGVKFAKADDPQEHEKAKKGLKNAIIGFVLIFVLIGALKLSMPVMTTWLDNYNGETNTSQTTTTDATK